MRCLCPYITDVRTLSLHVTDSLRHPEEAAAKRDTARELSELDWHKLELKEVLQRLNVSPSSGLEKEQVRRRVSTHGPNALSPPPRKLFRKWFGYLFGGFGSILFVGSVLCFIAWRPLGDPNPAVSNLALAVIILIVILFSTVFVSAPQRFRLTLECLARLVNQPCHGLHRQYASTRCHRSSRWSANSHRGEGARTR